MISDPPEDIAQRESVPFLAATAHKLANDYALRVPAWVFEPRCYLARDEPYFGLSRQVKCGLSTLFLYKSPAEFKHRNLFVDEFVLLRV